MNNIQVDYCLACGQLYSDMVVVTDQSQRGGLSAVVTLHKVYFIENHFEKGLRTNKEWMIKYGIVTQSKTVWHYDKTRQSPAGTVWF